MITPVGPLPPQVYWRRRALVIALAVVLLIGLVWFVVSRAAGSPSPSGAALAGSSSQESSADGPLTGVLASPTSVASSIGSGPSSPSSRSAASSARSSAAPSSRTTSSAAPTSRSATASSAPGRTTASATPSAGATAPLPQRTSTPTPQATLTPKPTPTSPRATATTGKAPATTAPPKTSTSAPRPTTPKPTPTTTAPVRDAQGRLLCTRQGLQLTTTVGAPTYPSGAKPILGLTVTNTGSAECTQDVSGSRQVFTVTSAGGRRIWSTSDCFPGTGTDVRTLQPGESLQYNIKWSGTSSQPGCTGDRAVVPAGTYRVTAALGGWSATPVLLELS